MYRNKVQQQSRSTANVTPKFRFKVMLDNAIRERDRQQSTACTIVTQRRTGAFVLLRIFFVEERRLQDAGEEDNLVACRHVVSVDGRRSRCPAAAATAVATTDYYIYRMCRDALT